MFSFQDAKKPGIDSFAKRTNMARIPLLQEEDPANPIAAREALRDVGEGRGIVLNVYRALANNPAALRAIHALSMATRTFPNGKGDGSLTPAQSELAYTAATVANRCFY